MPHLSASAAVYWADAGAACAIAAAFAASGGPGSTKEALTSGPPACGACGPPWATLPSMLSADERAPEKQLRQRVEMRNRIGDSDFLASVKYNSGAWQLQKIRQSDRRVLLVVTQVEKFLKKSFLRLSETEAS